MLSQSESEGSTRIGGTLRSALSADRFEKVPFSSLAAEPTSLPSDSAALFTRTTGRPSREMLVRNSRAARLFCVSLLLRGHALSPCPLNGLQGAGRAAAAAAAILSTEQPKPCAEPGYQRREKTRPRPPSPHWWSDVNYGNEVTISEM